jgi:hypothetical protein
LEHRREILRPIWSNANRDPDFYGNADTHFNRDTNFNCNRNSYAYFDVETFTYAETGANAQAASYAATAPITIYEKETHCCCPL